MLTGRPPRRAAVLRRCRAGRAAVLVELELGGCRGGRRRANDRATIACIVLELHDKALESIFFSRKISSGGKPISSRPHYSLDEVKRLVASGQFMLMKGRALNLLVPPLTYAEALRFVAAAVQLLSVDNFHRSVQLTHDVADEYGLNIDGTGWYIKLCIDQIQPEVTVISFHTPQFPMRTKAGTIKPP
jgi:hypothetical protein